MPRFGISKPSLKHNLRTEHVKKTGRQTYTILFAAGSNGAHRFFA